MSQRLIQGLHLWVGMPAPTLYACSFLRTLPSPGQSESLLSLTLCHKVFQRLIVPASCERPGHCVFCSLIPNCVLKVKSRDSLCRMWGRICPSRMPSCWSPESPAQNKVRVQGRLKDQRKLLASALSQHPASLWTPLSRQRDSGSLRLLKIELSIFDKMLLFLFDGSACFLPPSPTTLTFPAFLSAINLTHSWLFHMLLSASLGKPNVCCQDGWMGQSERAQPWEGRSKSFCRKNICPAQPKC